jgi:hypothetical protein
MPNAVCPKCELEYRPAVSGIAAESMSVDGPYQLWSADLRECPGCLNQVVYRFGGSPIAEHFEPGYAVALQFSQGKPHVRFWANALEKAAGRGGSPACRFYGMSGQGGLNHLIPSGGNQCALILASIAPCQMELNGQPPQWERCPLNPASGIRVIPPPSQ